MEIIFRRLFTHVKQYDYVIVGAGLYGATFQRIVGESGKKVLMIDRRDHIAGNCYSEEVSGIQVHKYGPHQFHTRSRRIWDFVNQFAEFNHYRAHIKANLDNKLYSIPPNMMMFHQLWGVNSPQEARNVIDSTRIPCERPENLRDYILDAVGEEVYEKFYRGYSLKQWGVDPSEIPVSVGRRLPIRFTWNDRWFEDEYEGIPKEGYTKMVENMICDTTEVQLGVDFFSERKSLERMAGKIVYTGKIDELMGYRYGHLEYRSLRFEEEIVEGDFQGNAIINYTSPDVPYTRITEHKHFAFKESPISVITREYPVDYKPCGGMTPYYPIENRKNRCLHEKYEAEVREELPNYIGGGRLFKYKYINMDQCIGMAIAAAGRELTGENRES